MIKVLILNLLLLCSTNALTSLEVAEPDNNSNGPVSNLMENLAQHTAKVTDELLAGLLTETNDTTKNLVANIEVVIATALNQLSQPIEDFQKELLSSECQPLILLQQLKQQINLDLSNCVKNLTDILNNFQKEAYAFKASLGRIVKEIIDIPTKCKTGSGFSSSINCYMDNISDINQQIIITLNNANETLDQVRQLSEIAVQESRTCANNVIASSKDYINQILDNCRLNEQ